MRKRIATICLVSMFFLISIISIFTIIGSADPPGTPMSLSGYTRDDTGRSIKDGVQVKAYVSYPYSEWFTHNIDNGGYGNAYTGNDFYINNTSPTRTGSTVALYIEDEFVQNVTGGFQGWAKTENLVIEDKPRITDYTNSTGTTGDPFTFNVTVEDYVDYAYNLTVRVNWSHGSLSANTTLSNTAGDFFGNIVPINLDHSISNMTYTIWANDSSAKFNSSGPHNVTVTDNDPPSTTLEIGEPLHPNGVTNNSNVTSSSTIYLNATDNVGSFYVNYRIWNSTGWSSLNTGSADTNSSFTLDEEGKNYVEYYANDSAGNNETHYNVTLWVDNTAPTTTPTIGSPVYPSSQNNSYLTSSSDITLNAVDAPSHNSGVNTIEYRYWNSTSSWTSWNTYSTAFNLGADDGIYYLEFNSTDNLGNTEYTKNWTLIVDNTLVIVEIGYNNSDTYFKENDKLKIYANFTETGAGIDDSSVKITIDTSGTDENSASMTAINNTHYYYNWTVPSGSDGIVNVSIDARDNVSNLLTGLNWSLSKYIDNTAPVCNIEYNSSATYFAAGSKLKVYANFTEDLSGIDENTVLISVDYAGTGSDISEATMNKTNNKRWTYNLTIPSGNDGTFTVTVNASDNASNSVSQINAAKKVDNTGPTATIDNINDFVNSLSSVTGTATDGSGVGVQKTQIRIYNSTDGTNWTGSAWGAETWIDCTGYTPWSNDTSSVNLATSKNYTIYARAYDNLSNLGTTVSDSFGYDTTKPESRVTNITGYWKNNSNITIQATASDEFSGLYNVSLYYYNSTDNSTWSAATLYDVDSDPWASISWNFTFPDNSSYYRFYTIAIDNASNTETAPTNNDTGCYYNTTKPNTPSTPSGSASKNTGSSTAYSTSATDVDGDQVQYRFDWGDGTYSSWTSLVNSSTSASKSKSWSSTGTYSVKAQARDEHGAVSDWSSALSVTITSGGGSSPSGGGNPGGGDLTGPTTPGNVRCTSASSDSTPSFAWDESTDSSDVAGYFVKIDDGTYTSIGDVTTYTWPTSLDDGTYTFYVRAEDTVGNTGDPGSCEFTIDTTGGAGNQAPTADAGGPYSALTFENITFDGSESTDSDGTIENYTWDFGDGNTSYEENPVHSYNSSGLFNVTLTVTDNNGATDINLTTVKITLDTDADGYSDDMEDAYNTNKEDPEESPKDTDGDGIPDDPSPDGEYSGDTDDDGDNVSDEIEEKIGSDPKKDDVKEVKIENITYYLIDEDGDGVADIYYNAELEKAVDIQKQSDGTVLIDEDGDGEWDYIYNPVSGVTQVYISDEDEGIPWFIYIFVIFAIIAIIVFTMFKTGYLYIEEEKEPETKKPEKKKPSSKKDTKKKTTKKKSSRSKSTKKKK